MLCYGLRCVVMLCRCACVVLFLCGCACVVLSLLVLFVVCLILFSLSFGFVGLSCVRVCCFVSCRVGCVVWRWLLLWCGIVV